MSITSILTPARTHCCVTGASKKRVLEKIAELISGDIPALDAATLFKSLINREKLGSTGIGEGIAIPHCRMGQCTGITGALIRLERAIEFDAMDDKPVDLLFVLLVPEQACDEHLQLLGELARLFSREEVRAGLRSAPDDQSLYRTAVEFATGADAAQDRAARDQA